MADDADEVEVVPASAVKRGPNFSCAEDYELARAWIATSEDAVVGANQRHGDFKKKFNESYYQLVKQCNDTVGSSYPLTRGDNSAHNRFRKISRLCLKLIGIEKAVGDPPSGDTQKEEWDLRVKELFFKKNPDGKNILENILAARSFLGDHPKWIAYEESEECGKKRVRPEGNKKAKEKEADKKFIVDCMQNSIAGGSDKKLKYTEKKEGFMEAVSTSVAVAVQAFTSSMAESNELKLLEWLDPDERRSMAKKLLEAKLAKAEAAAVVAVNITENVSTLTSEDD